MEDEKILCVLSNKECLILAGPSKFDLMIAMFERSNRLLFTVKHPDLNKKRKIEVHVKSISWKQAEVYEISGVFYDVFTDKSINAYEEMVWGYKGIDGIPRKSFHARYNAVTRKGTLLPQDYKD